MTWHRISALCFLALTAPLSAQSAEDSVKAVNQAMLRVGLSGNKEAFGRLMADDLQWVRANGLVLAKPEYIATINPGLAKSARTFTDETVSIYGDIALLICRSDFVSPQGERRAERVLRVFIRRENRWLLLRHAASPITP
jgi:uncharacterized protein (TIGR02246 family)